MLRLNYNKLMKRLWIFFLFVATFAAAVPAHATGETITNFKSLSRLSTENVLTVHETIMVDFSGTSHHGIYRTIPIVRQGTDGLFYYKFKILSASEKYQLTNNGESMKIRLGDAKTTSSEAKQYEIEYTLSPVALQTNQGDRTIINVTGEKWEYPILRAQYELSLPAAPAVAPNCYAGPSGSTEQKCTIIVSGSTITAISTQILEPGSGLSVDAYLPSNTFSTYLVANQKPSPAPRNIILQIVFYILSLIVVGLTLLSLILAIKDKLRKRNQTVVAQYEAPNGLAPAQIGLLSDNKVDSHELSATLLDLAVRGYIKISLITPKTWLRKADYRFDKQKDFSGLNSYESALVAIFFDDEDKTITMSQVNLKLTSSPLSMILIIDIKQQIAKGLKDSGYYSYIPTTLCTQLIGICLFFAIWVSAFGVNLLSIYGLFYSSTIVAAAIVIGQVIFLRRRAKLTPEGLEEWAKVEGFKLYLKVAESARIDFSDAPDKTPERFNALLPYAVALGVEKQWAKQFAGIDLSQSSGWYTGDNNALTAAVFAHSFSSGFSGAMSSGFSGLSGGGSVGGGSGGGGGGGW